MHIHEISTHSLGLSLVLLLVIIPSPQSEHVLLPSFGLFGVAINYSGHFLVENPVVNIGLFWVEIFVEGCSDDAVIINCYAELLSQLIEISIVSIYNTC